jgi:hypothetical protein
MISVYQITVPADGGRVYIGATGRPKSRFNEHFNAKTPLGEAMRAAGRDAVQFEIIASGDQARMCQLEKDLIDLLGTKLPDGFNSRDGGSGNVAEEARCAALHVKIRPTIKGLADQMAIEDRRSLAQFLEILLEQEADRRKPGGAEHPGKAR